jgi:enoyl-CoA hydratase
MSSLVLRSDDKDGRCTLTLNRPDALNALNTALFQELDAHLDDIAAKTATIGCVVVRGAGRSFCAGADLKDISSGAAATVVPNFKPKVIEKLARLPQPVVAQVHGHCFTGGVELVLACDLVVAAETARFADTHGKWGLVGAWGLTQRLPRKIGAAKAKEMMFTARTFSAKQAESMGLINSVAPDDKLESEVNALVAAILANSWHSNFGNKRLLMQTGALPLDAGLAYEIYNHPGRAPDIGERLKSFAKKA